MDIVVVRRLGITMSSDGCTVTLNTNIDRERKMHTGLFIFRLCSVIATSYSKQYRPREEQNHGLSSVIYSILTRQDVVEVKWTADIKFEPLHP